MAKQRSYNQILTSLETPPDHNKVITCRFCGEPMHWIQINKYIGYWIHKGESIKKCAEQNPLIKGKPVVAQNIKFYKKLSDLWTELTNARQNTRKR